MRKGDVTESPEQIFSFSPSSRKENGAAVPFLHRIRRNRTGSSTEKCQTCHFEAKCLASTLRDTLKSPRRSS